MKTFTIDDIREWSPCYDPMRYLPEGWRGTAVEVLARKDIPAEDRAWVVLREELLDKKTLRLFAVWCGREALKTLENPDSRLITACAVAERFAHGKATATELSDACDDASEAGRELGWDAAWGAVRDTAWAAAIAATWAADKAAAKEASWIAARAVASDAGRVAASDDALDDAREAQLEQLSKIILQ